MSWLLGTTFVPFPLRWRRFVVEMVELAIQRNGDHNCSRFLAVSEVGYPCRGGRQARQGPSLGSNINRDDERGCENVEPQSHSQSSAATSDVL